MTHHSDLRYTDRALLLLILPVAGELALHYAVGFADTLMVAGVSEAAVSGVSLMDFVVSFFNSVLTALAVGGGVVVGQHYGGHRREESSSAVAQTLLLLAAAGAALAVIAAWLTPFVTGRLFGHLAADVRTAASTYYGTILLSLPFLGIYSAGAAAFRAYGNTALPLRIMIIANLLNVAGNAVAIYALSLGVRGVALATLGARILAAAAVVALLLRRMARAGMPIRMRLRMRMSAKIARLGVPYCFENGMFYLGRVLVLIMVASFGTASIAANAVAQAVVLFQVLPGMAAVTGITVVVARCVGAGDYRLAEHYTARIVRGVYLSHAVSCIAVCAALPLILSAYGLSAEATELARRIVLIHAAFVMVVWPMSYCLPATFRAAGDTRFPMKVSVACMIACRVGFSWLLGVWMGMGVVGVWLGMFGDWIVKGAIFILRYRGRRWQSFRVVE